MSWFGENAAIEGFWPARHGEEWLRYVRCVDCRILYFDLIKPKCRYTDFCSRGCFELVMAKLRTWAVKQGCRGERLGNLCHNDMPRWLEKSQDKSTPNSL